MTSIIWFRDDLRVADHAALLEAAGDPDGVTALYVLDETSPEARPLGGAARWWLHHSLGALRRSLAELGVPLTLRRGSAERVLPEVVREAGAQRVVWNRRYGPERDVDARLKSRLRADDIDARSFVGGLLFEPWTIATGEGTAYRVYSAFWRACMREPAPARPLPAPDALAATPTPVPSDSLEEWGLLDARWAHTLEAHCAPGEKAANDRLDEFLDERVSDYDRARDVPSLPATSGLSPHLRWGEISPRTVWWRALEAAGTGIGDGTGDEVGGFLSELGWREFAWHTLFHRGALESRGLDRRYDAFPWRSEGESAAETAAWRKGETGFGLVDAGMRELWQTGVMHNRVRMVVASFLTKNLLVDWRVGEAWFWDTLVDADRASNPFNWQWVAGCGVDAAPYFRVFNPVTQQKKFDPDGKYVDRWAPDSLLTPPIVDLAETRQRALDAYEQIRGLPRA